MFGGPLLPDQHGSSGMLATYPEDGSGSFLQNARKFQAEYTASHPRRLQQCPKWSTQFQKCTQRKSFLQFPSKPKNTLVIKGVFHSALQLRSKQSLLLQIFTDATLRIPQTDAYRSSCNVVLLIPTCAETDGAISIANPQKHTRIQIKLPPHNNHNVSPLHSQSFKCLLIVQITPNK